MVYGRNLEEKQLASLTFAITTSKNTFNKGAPQFHNLRNWNA